VEIVIHSHHADVSDHMRKRALRAVERAATRVPRIVEGIVRFEEDGPTRRVTVTLRAPKHHDLMGKAEGRFFGPALAGAIAKVLAQAGKEKRSNGRGSPRRAAARARG
jgi:ribosome-associated translation inhibitor RaiA